MLTRHPVVFAAVAGAALILGLVVALTPQFLSSAASSSYERALEGRCDSSYNGLIDPHFGGFLPVTEESRTDLASAMSTHPNLEDPIATFIGPTVGASVQGGSTFPMVPIHRTGYRDRIEVVQGGESGGIWLDVYAATAYDIEVGDVLEFTATGFTDTGEQQIDVAVPVTAITEDKVDLRTIDYWCGLEDYLGLTTMGDRKPPVGLMDLETFQTTELDRFSSEYWELPVLVDGLSLGSVDEILAVFDQVSRDMLFGEGLVVTDITAVRERVIEVRNALGTSVQPLALVVTLVALGLLAGAASYWADRRRSELELLSALGVGPPMIGVKAVLEMTVPVALGLAIGVVGSFPISNVVGPGGTIELSARGAGAWRFVPAFGAALVVVGLVATVRSARLLSSRRRRRSWLWLAYPVTVGLLLGAFLLQRRLSGGTVVFGENDIVGSVDPLVVLFPILIFAAVAIIAATLVLLGFRAAKQVVRANSSYLAVRRVLSSPTPAIVLFAAALVPVATLVYSAALTRSSETTVQAKGRVFIGSDLRAPVFRLEPLPTSLESRATYVSRAERVELAGVEIDFMVIEPESFPAGAFWEPSFADVSLEELLGTIAAPEQPLRALVANADVGAEEGLVELDRIEVPVQIVGEAVSFPGARVDRPIVVVSRASYEEFLAGIELPPSGSDGTDDFLWVTGDDYEVIELELSRADIGFAFTTTVAETLDLTKFQVIIWTFDFLELYAGLAGVIVIGAILLYADTRQRARNLSYALATRMGLLRTEHLAAGVLEIGILLVIGVAVGSIAANVAARAIYKTLDALPATPPGPIWRGTTGLSLILVVVAIGVALLASLAAQRTADRADVSELLRHGD